MLLTIISHPYKPYFYLSISDDLHLARIYKMWNERSCNFGDGANILNVTAFCHYKPRHILGPIPVV